MLQDKERKPGDPRLLAVDNQLVVPTGVVVRMQVIGAEVIHAFAVPSFGIKVDAVPGRLNETWFRVDREGVYYGQCSELCGQAPSEDPDDLHGHAFMPIAVHAVSPAAFDAWAKTAKTDLKAAYQMYGTIWERLVKTLYSGGGPKEALASAPTKEFNDIMGPSDEFVRRAFESLWAYLSPDA